MRETQVPALGIIPRARMLPARKSLSEIRSQVCDTTLVWFAILAILALSLNVVRALEIGWRPAPIIYAAVSFVLWIAAICRARLAFRLKAGIIVGLLFLNACGALATLGAPSGLQQFVGGSIMAAVLFGRRAGIAAVCLSLGIMLATYATFHFGIIAPPDLNRVALLGVTWVANAGGLVITSVGPIVAVSALIAQLDRERAIADDANNAKSSFLATISHELRTPMTGILGLSELMLAGSLTAELRETVQRINKSGQWLLGLINDLLDFSKIEQNEVTLEDIPFSLGEVLEEINELCQPLAASKGLQLNLDRTLPRDAFMGDPTRLRQVIYNLVGNAIKFTERGSVAVQTRLSDAGGNAATLHVDVRDTGIGISPDKLDRLFAPFSQGDTTITRRFGGTGLGLAISQRLVRLMGGELTVSSQVGIGSQFSFTIPLAKTAVRPEAAVPQIGRPISPSVATKRRLRILMAEDSETIRYLLEVALTQRGHTVTCANDGQEALQAAKSDTYDVVLMDIHMPVMDGIEATKAIRALPGRASLPIIAFTADILVDQRAAFSQAGFARVLSKPVDLNALFLLLEDEQDLVLPATSHQGA